MPEWETGGAHQEHDQGGRTLKSGEARFQQIVEAAPSAMILANAAGNIEMVNAQAERLFGYAREELLGQPVEILIPQTLRSDHPRLRQQFFASPSSRPMGAGRDLFGVRKDGTKFPIEIGLNPIETEAGTMVLSSIVDLSERKRMEERFRRVVEFAPNAIVMINALGKIEMVNAQAETLFGYGREELLGRSIELLIPERFRRNHPELRQSFLEDPRSRPMGAGRDLFALRKDGTEFPVEIGLNPLETYEGTMILSAIVDISDRVLKEKSIRQALKEKEIMLGEIHHRVKNNLHIVHSLLDLQMERLSDNTVLDMMRDSQNRIRSMALIHQTLYESNDFSDVDFGAFLDTLIPTLKSSYCADPDRVLVSVAADDVRLPINAAIPCGLIVNELMSNIFKHAFPERSEGEVSVVLETVDVPAPRGEHVRLVVTDNGVGLDDNLDIAKTQTLGLQLVLLLVEQLHGHLTLKSRNPTQFTIDFHTEPLSQK